MDPSQSPPRPQVVSSNVPEPHTHTHKPHSAEIRSNRYCFIGTLMRRECTKTAFLYHRLLQLTQQSGAVLIV